MVIEFRAFVSQGNMTALSQYESGMYCKYIRAVLEERERARGEDVNKDVEEKGFDTRTYCYM